MKPRLFKKNQIIEVLIVDYAFGGVGIAKIETEKGSFAVFVQNALPGQLVRARVEKCDQRFAECKLMDVLKPSPDEVDTGFQSIPGAPYSRLPIELQRSYKLKSTKDLFERIGKVNHFNEVMDEFITSPDTWHYRNKMEYSFSMIRYDLYTGEELDEFALGFKHRGTWWMVENLDADSGLFDAQFESSLQKVRDWCKSTGLPAWHPPKRTGFYRFLVVRKSHWNNQLLINLVTADSHLAEFDTNAFTLFMQQLLGDRLAGLIHTINPDIGERTDPLNGSWNLLCGQSFIVEEILSLKFEVSMQSFFQTNPRSAERLYAKAIQYAAVNDEDDGKIILDLFCGTGTITQLLAKDSKRKVIGVDIVEAAIADAKLNAERNSVKRVEFFAADAGKFLYEYPEFKDRIEVIVLDPPRGGIAPKTLQKVLALGAKSIVYISCNPATQARDTLAMVEAGYVIEKLSLVDQFPHTAHIESVVLYKKK